MFVKFIECGAIDIELRIDLAQETASRTHILNNKMAYSGNYLAIILRQDITQRGVAQSYGQEI